MAVCHGLEDAFAEIRALREERDALQESLRWALMQLDMGGDGCGCGENDCDYCPPHRLAHALANDCPEDV